MTDPEERAAKTRELFDILKNGLYDALASAPEILFITSAGNEDNDVEFDVVIPSSFNLPNLMVVGALDQAAPLQGWDLPEDFATLRRLLEAEIVEICPLAYMRGRTLDERLLGAEIGAASGRDELRALAGLDARGESRSEIKERFRPGAHDPLPLEMMMVSHIDDDHIGHFAGLQGAKRRGQIADPGGHAGHHPLRNTHGTGRLRDD